MTRQQQHRRRYQRGYSYGRRNVAYIDLPSRAAAFLRGWRVAQGYWNRHG